MIVTDDMMNVVSGIVEHAGMVARMLEDYEPGDELADNDAAFFVEFVDMITRELPKACG